MAHKDIKQPLFMSPEDYLKERVDDQIEWYSRKGGLNKKWYIRLQVATIIFSVSIPFVTDFITETTAYFKYLVSFMGLTIAAIMGLMALMKYRDNWIEYRTTAEILRHERFMFLTGAGAYATRDRFKLFVETIEDILSKEVDNWKNFRAANTEKEEEKDPPAVPPPTIKQPIAGESVKRYEEPMGVEVPSTTEPPPPG